MARTQKHIVKKGESLSSIAQAYMIVDWKTEIWAASFNTDLRKKTKNPKKIEPGWEVHIPIVKMPAGKIYAQVGLGKFSFNRPDDLKVVKGFLNKHAKSLGLKEVSGTAKADTAFITSLKTFQKANGLRVDGIIAPDGKTHQALARAPELVSGQKPQEKREIRIGKYTCAADDGEILKCLKEISQHLSKQVKETETRIQSARSNYEQLEKHSFATMAVSLSGNSRIYDAVGTNLSKAEAAIKDAKTKTAKAEAKSLLAGQKSLNAAVHHINIAGRALQKTVNDTGASVKAFVDVVVVVDAGTTIVLESLLIALTKKPIVASTLTAMYKQTLAEVFGAFVNPRNYGTNGGINGAVCRVIIKSAEGALHSKVGQIISKRSGPFSEEMGRYIQRSGLLGVVLRDYYPGLLKLVFKKYGTGLTIVYPKLVETDISIEIMQKAIDTLWSAGSPLVLKYFTDWYDTYHIDLCNMMVKSKKSPEAVAASLEKQARSSKVCVPVVKKFIAQNQDAICKEVVALMKNKANAPA